MSKLLALDRPDVELRLVGGSSNNEGRVEVFYNGQWGTICDDSWDDSDAGIVCRQLGLGDSGTAVGSAAFGQGVGQIWLDNVSCTGSESNIGLCGSSGWGIHNCGHHEDAGVRCELNIRLVGGTNALEGRVEVYHDGQWGTICDNSWDDNDATVVCRQLGFGVAGTAVCCAELGEGVDTIWLSRVNCAGSESNLAACGNNGWGIHSCTHSEDAGVRCNSDVELRLVGGSSNNEGRVEVFYEGQWGTICDDSWDDSDASIVCRQLGFGDSGTAVGSAAFGQGVGQIWLDNVSCTGSESNIGLCGSRGWGIHNCGHHEDAGVRCELNIRLVGGTNALEGRVEVYHDGQWGTICDNSWDDNDATVVCRQLGFGVAGTAVCCAELGEGVDTIWLSRVNCAGSESNLAACGNNGWGIHSCTHSEDAGVRCNSDVELRLVGGSSNNEGRVEIFYDGQWGTICDDSWDDSDAGVVCRQLGFGDSGTAVGSAAFGQGVGQIWLDNVSCTGSESNIGLCRSSGWGIHNCGHHEDAGVRCELNIRLVGGTNALEGRVEVYHDGQWGTICDNSWDDNDATVVCRQLGLGFAGTAVCCAELGEGVDTIWLSRVNCAGSESNLAACGNNGWGIHSCTHSEDAGVRCNSDVELRLVGGSSNNEGRVEVFYDGQWGTICDDSWGDSDADVVCRQLGFGDSGTAVGSAEYGQGVGQIWLDNVSCTGSESNIGLCGSSGWGIHNCGHHEDAGVRCELRSESNLAVCGNNGWGIHSCAHSEDAGVRCNSDVELRLVGGSSINEGRVEVFYEGQWGTICDDSWDDSDAEVVCRQLGLGDSGTAVGSAEFGQGVGQIWLDNVSCTGSESNIGLCGSSGWGIHNCGHGEDAGVRCEFDIRLVGGTNALEGRVEVYHDGQWGTICDNSWDDNDATVVCRQLGLGFAGTAVCCAELGEGVDTIWLSRVNCAGSESNLAACGNNGWGIHSCTHSEDAGVRCNSDVELRLVGGSSNNEGRVEVFYDGQWGTICDDSWDDFDADVVCRQLGFGDSGTAVGSAAFGQGVGQIWLDNVSCTGSESNIGLCRSSGWGIHNCGHHEDAGVRCELAVTCPALSTINNGAVPACTNATVLDTAQAPVYLATLIIIPVLVLMVIVVLCILRCRRKAIAKNTTVNAVEEDEQNNYILPDSEHDGELINARNNKTLLRPEPIEVIEFRRFMNRNKDDVTKDIFQQFMNHEGKTSFIAAQGPQESTVDDFWKMVWQENVKTIVMITDTNKENKGKGKPEVHLVTQVKVHNWSDEEIPKDTTSIISVIRKVKSWETEGCLSPFNGVGATGTFIALYCLMDIIKKKKEINVFQFVEQMRKDRMDMVQTRIQYMFIFESILAALQTTDSYMLYDQLKQLSHSAIQHKSKKEFKVLQERTAKKHHVDVCIGKSPKNQHKNRFTNIVPEGKFRPVLKSEGNANDSNSYINASHLMDFEGKEFIMTQTPLPSTIEDFWRLVYDYACTSVVMLNKIDASDSKFVFVDHYAFRGWAGNRPDVSVLRKFIRSTESKAPGPVLVHCIDGVGLSGVYIIAKTEIDRLESEGAVDVFQSLQRLRKKCPFAIQTEEQYTFCYQLLKDHLENSDEYAEVY
ncbi:Deleted in malignant brain tumors 1 protein [Holothuria leucospilota]|uniref:Deleted in malignant brain tumors 1 protein n=1 Tax=Holothuria leucospilota TaxID=206669 RepID=A0A9Q1BR49_HOLLE|nr:Deleted in malignant brain tumors 1 protein [Holothuria leucospilota]